MKRKLRHLIHEWLLLAVDRLQFEICKGCFIARWVTLHIDPQHRGIAALSCSFNKSSFQDFHTLSIELFSVRAFRGTSLERLLGYRRMFETEITDGEHKVYGRGPTAEAS